MEKFIPNGLKFSDSALNHFSLMLENNSDMNAIRIGVKKAGCSDMNISLNLLINNLRLMKL
mgnify:CR=1 FL=1